jgi:hypothetical protein
MDLESFRKASHGQKQVLLDKGAAMKTVWTKRRNDGDMPNSEK